MARKLLRECPFCGDSTALYWHWDAEMDESSVRCGTCGAAGPTLDGDQRTTEELNAAWNRRVLDRRLSALGTALTDAAESARVSGLRIADEWDALAEKARRRRGGRAKQ